MMPACSPIARPDLPRAPLVRCAAAILFAIVALWAAFPGYFGPALAAGPPAVSADPGETQASAGCSQDDVGKDHSACCGASCAQAVVGSARAMFATVSTTLLTVGAVPAFASLTQAPDCPPPEAAASGLNVVSSRPDFRPKCQQT